MFKLASVFLMRPLMNLFDEIIESGDIPEQWNLAEIERIFRKKKQIRLEQESTNRLTFRVLRKFP